MEILFTLHSIPLPFSTKTTHKRELEKVALKIICLNASKTQQKLYFLAQKNGNISGKTNMKRNIHEYLTCMKKFSKSDFRFGTFPPDAKLSNVNKFSIPSLPTLTLSINILFRILILSSELSTNVYEIFPFFFVACSTNYL
jgi:hypothetical protein